ncbi:MAG: manganese efflux pump MntP family protein [Nitrospirota bacterium]
MEIVNTFIVAFALAMDSFTVSISGGAIMEKVRVKNAILVGAYFGLFQCVMFVLGYVGGDNLRNYIDSYDHWIALGLLIFIGGKMIIESFSKTDGQAFSLKHKTLLILAIATSIDALGVGLSYSFLNKSVLVPSITIGIVAFLFSGFGLYLGKILKQILKKKAELIGGIILIAIGINIAIEHGAFSF